MADDRYRKHNELVNKVLLHLHRNFTGRYWNNPTGAVKTEHGHFQRYGLKGSCDIIGFTDQGRFVGVEIKTGSGLLSVDQKKFQKMVLKNNGLHFVVHEDFEAMEFKGMRKR